MKLSKINQEILDVTNRLREIEDFTATDEFDTREGHIVANVKVYQWLELDDLEEIIKDNTEEIKELVREEFDNDRLNSAADHAKEWAVTSHKEQMEDKVHLDNYYERKEAYRIWLKDKCKGPLFKKHEYYYKYLKKEWRKFSKCKYNTHLDYWKYLYKNHKEEIDAWDKINTINHDVWQYGRSGGWLSICETSELENHEFDCLLPDDEAEDDNRLFNLFLEEEVEVIYYYGSKKKYLKHLKEQISDWEAKYEYIKELVEYLEDQIKTFKEDYMIPQLENDIDNFLSDINVTVKNVEISIKGSQLKTSKGISVNIEDFYKAYRFTRAKALELLLNGKKDDLAKVNFKISDYTVEYFKKIDNDILVKAGCHNFSWKDIVKTMKLYEKILFHHGRGN